MSKKKIRSSPSVNETQTNTIKYELTQHGTKEASDQVYGQHVHIQSKKDHHRRSLTTN